VRAHGHLRAFALVAALVAVGCGTPELVVSEPPPDHPDGVVVVTTVPPDGSGDTESPVFVEDPNATTSTEATTTSESTTSSAPTTVVTTTTTAPPPPTTQPPPPPPATAADASVAYVNQRRADNGRAALQVDPALVALADGWAHQLASDKNLRHNPQLNQQIPNGYRAWGENVGYAWAADVIDNGWWNSEGHRNNILSANYDSVGIAFVVDDSGTYWGVQVFGGH
jgi:uncharacterized protein YkwD